jgi:predicted DNA-binding ribbon-helix-helix protein
MEMDLAHESVWNFTGYIRVICVMQLVDRVNQAHSMESAGSYALLKARESR